MRHRLTTRKTTGKTEQVHPGWQLVRDAFPLTIEENIMNLKIHATLPGSEFNLTSSLNLLPFHALLNKLFRRVVQPQVETTSLHSLEQVRKINLFEEGWLPDILPASTHRIQIRKNLLLDYAQGEFYFAPADWHEFSAKLRHEETMNAPFVNWPKSLRQMQGEGHSLWYYREREHHWVFFCKADKGYCEYVMWNGQDNKSGEISC
jgi:hypothetical protein